MYTKQEASAIRQEFWTVLGKYLSPIPSAAGHKINWVNYKTGVKNILFKMDADKNGAIARIEIRGEEIKQAMIFEHFLSLKKIAAGYLNDKFTWQREAEDEHGKIIACIYCEKEDVNIFKKEDWPQLISFFKEHIISFDKFWADHKEIFEMVQ